MGELAVMTVSLANSLKYDGLFTLQTQSNGPVSMMVVDVTSAGTLRGYARFNKKKMDKYAGPSSVPYLMGSGHIAFTVDQGLNMERYQGITLLEGASLSECAQNYFRQSEQLETAILVTADPTNKKAAALMIQKMPKSGKGAHNNLSHTSEEDDENWRKSVIIMSSMTTDELLNTSINTEDLLYRLYHENGVRIYDRKPIKFKCRCSRKKVLATLASFPAKELVDMKTDKGFIVATCEFCRTAYKFNDPQICVAKN
jgi:molecular chaperone Hsp33